VISKQLILAFTGSYISGAESQVSTIVCDGLKLSGTQVIQHILGRYCTCL